MFRPLDFSKFKAPPATVATNATDRTPNRRNVAIVATVAAAPSGDEGARVPHVATVAVSQSADANSAFLTERIEERAAIAEHDGGVPRVYCDAWARLQCRKPMRISEEDWRCALDDAGCFLDSWGSTAAELGWPVGAIFDVPRENESDGLIWVQRGATVESLAPRHARLNDGRTFHRLPTGSASIRGARENLRSSS